MGYFSLPTFPPTPFPPIAIFNWDNDKSSKKLSIEEDQLTIKVKDGSGFKTSLGDAVILFVFEE